MELRQYFNIIIKRMWLIILLPLVASAASAYVSLYMLEPMYESNITLYVINKNTNGDVSIAYNDLLVGQSLVKDYREIVKSRTVTQTVIDELGLTGMSSGGLAENISVNSKNDTRIIEIKVQDKNAEKAKSIANKVGDVFMEKVIDLMKVENVSIIDYAESSESPVSPRPMLNIAIAFCLGLMLTAGLIFLLEYIDDTIKTPDDVAAYLKLTVLGTIPKH